MTIVGDAYAGPLIQELRRRSYDLSSLVRIASGGAATGDQHKHALVELLPHVTIMDGYGASETGGMAYGTGTATDEPLLRPGRRRHVVSADRSRFLEPGDDEIGWVTRRGRVPLGYLGDRDADRGHLPHRRRRACGHPR